MAILGSAAYIFTVVNVKDSNLLFAYELVKVVDDSVKIVNDIIATVMCMAGIKADTQLFVVDNTIVDACKFLKRPSDLGSLSCHCLQGNITVRVLAQDCV